MGSYASKYAKAAACLATLTTLAHSALCCLSVCLLFRGSTASASAAPSAAASVVDALAFHTENCKQTYTDTDTHEWERSE